MVRVVLVSDEAVIAEGLRAMLHNSERAQLVLAAATMEEAAEFESPSGDSVLVIQVSQTLDVNRLRALCFDRGHRVCLFAHSISTELFYQAREAGVCGVLCTRRTATEIVNAICAMAEGQLFFDPLLQQPAAESRAFHLTPREGHLVELLTQGMKNKEIAYHLGITEGTVKVYLSKLFQKVGAKDRFDLALSGLKNLGLASTSEAFAGAEPYREPSGGIRTLVTRIPPENDCGLNVRQKIG